MRVCILLGGCGHYDGTDPREAVLTLLALEEAGETPALVAPAIPQERTVDHLTGDAQAGEPRDVLRESARLTRGRVRDLAESDPVLFDALLIPGGYGPVVNFSTGFAQRGAARGVVPEVAAFIRHFLETGKPIGLVSLGEVPVRTVLGEEILIAEPPRDPRALTIDRERRLVHTPGFAAFTRLADVKAGIEAMVGEVLRLMEEAQRPASGRGAGTRPGEERP